jgi:hypothetical protein
MRLNVPKVLIVEAAAAAGTLSKSDKHTLLLLMPARSCYCYSCALVRKEI